MKFYYNPSLNICVNESWLIDYLRRYENQFALYSHDEMRDELHSRREVCGWFECQVSNTIEEAMYNG